MALFVLIFLTVYGGLNSYVYFTIASGLGSHSSAIALVLLFLVFSPIILRFSEGRVPKIISTALAWVGYNWMGVSLLFAFIALVMDIAQLFLAELSQSEALLLVSSITLIASVYGFLESRCVRIRFLKVQSPKLDGGTDRPFRIVQVSDLHLGYGTLPGQVRGVVEKLKDLRPDLLVSTGDLFDTDLENLADYVDQLKTIRPPGGKIAVSGNHEVYAGLEQALKLTEESGFKVLRSESIKAEPGLFIAGVDDPEALNGIPEEAEEEVLRNIPESAFIILLKHRPRISSSTVDSFDLQLSGHTHGGQIFPFILMTWLQYKIRHGLTKIANQTYIYLSRGTGSWGPQMRVFAPPEITVFDLSHGEKYLIEKMH
jgi:predicted MPP superfamily phosphohydrolase